MKTSLLCAIIISLAVNCLTFAQWPNDPNINLVLSDTTTTGSHLSPQAVSDGNGGAIIVWSAQNYIHGQRLNSEGFIQWQKFGIDVGTSHDPVILSYLINPVIVSDDSGGAIIAWAEYNARRIIGVSRIRPDGTKVWDKLMCYSTTGTRLNPSIAADGNSGAFVTWEDTRNGSSNTDIYVQHISFDGTISWDSNGVAACLAVQNQTQPRVAGDGLGGVFVTWTDNRILDSDIYVQLFNSQGERQFQVNGMPVCTMSNNPAGDPRIVNTSVGQAIIAWTDGRSGGTWDLYAQGVDQDTTLWAINGVSVATEIRDQWKCEMIADGSDGAIISWEDSRRISFNENDVYAQRISSSGQVEWGLNGIPVCTQPGNTALHLDMSKDGYGGAIICWQDERNGNTDLYAQRISGGGNPLWLTNGVAVSTAPYSQISVTICNTQSGSAAIAWADARHGAYLYIYGQGVDSTGTLGGTTSVEEENFVKTFALEQNYPNPFNPTTNIKFSIANPGSVSLKVYDVLGREVTTLVNEEKHAGVYEVSFDASSLSSGIYFYKLKAGSYIETKKMILQK